MNYPFKLTCMMAGAIIPSGFVQAQEKTHQGKAEASAPNIIYILADDLGYSDLSCYGQTRFTTPNIDQLCSDGLKFTNHYAGCTVSAPSRCSLMTGLHTGHAPIRGNAGENIGGLEFDTSLPASYTTVAECLKEKDYTTACIGKWGMGGPNTVGHPNNQGFDYFYGHLGQGHAHYSYPNFLYENHQQVRLSNVETDPSKYNMYAQDLFMEKATQFITDNKDKPFFLYFSVTIPHAELVVPEEYATPFVGTFADSPWTTNGHYGTTPHKHASFAGMVTRLDGDVGKIRKLLEELGIDKNTLIIFTSDNGPHAEGGADPNFFLPQGGLRGIKRDMYEGGIRIPMIACWPDAIQAGRTSNHISAFWDVLPTFCEMTGATIPSGLDGISFYPELIGKEQVKQHDYLFWEFHETPSQAIRKGDWKAIRKNITTTSSTVELYNLATDPTERTNLASQYPEVVKELKALMIESHTNDTRWKFPTEQQEETNNDTKVSILRGDANQANSGQGIEYSFDGNMGKPYYHSPWSSGATNFPVVLTYYFDASEQIDYVKYYPRSDGNSNGNFGQFNLYVQTEGQSIFELYGTYDFKESPNISTVNFTNGLKKPKGIRFEVLSGGGNLVSCAEMEFYRKEETTAIPGIQDDSIRIYTQGRKIRIEGQGNQTVYVFSANGSRQDIRNELNPGLYLVRVGETVKKIIIPAAPN